MRQMIIAQSVEIVQCVGTTSKEKQELSEETGQVVSVEEQTAQLENELFIKERETLDVLKELESTKKIIAELKLKIQREETETSPKAEKSDEGSELLLAESNEEQPENIVMDEGHLLQPSALMEFELVKENLSRTTGDLAAIRATVEALRDSIGKERTLLDSGREKLTSDAALISSLESELDQTSQKLQTLKDLQTRREHPSDIFIEIKKMASEVRQLRSMADASKSEAVMLTAEIEQAKASIGTAEARCIAAKKMEEAARAAEAVALADIKALLSSESSSEGSSSVSDAVTLSVEEYAMMHSKAQEADHNSRKKVQEVMLQVDVANSSECDSVRKLEDAKLDVEECKKALQEALERAEAANHGKLAVDDIVRRWRCESGHKRRSIGGSPKFKNAGYRRKHSHNIDVVSDISSSSSFKPTLSIGQILTMKLTGPDGYDKSVWDDKTGELPAVSLGQIINRKSGVLCTEDPKRISGKRKKFALTGLSVLLAKQSKSKKKRESL
uniref:Uncharacterized protein n=1 Tax=Avena sativa TaxID=4498 RepID=A0ACD5YMC6_AVESA